MRKLTINQFYLVAGIYTLWSIFGLNKSQSNLKITYEIPTILKIAIPFAALLICQFALLINFNLLDFKFSDRCKNNLIYFLFFNLIVVFPLVSFYFDKTTFAEDLYGIFRVSLIKPIFADYSTIMEGISCRSVNKIGDLINCSNSANQVAWNYPTILLRLRDWVQIFNHSLVIFILVAFALNILQIGRAHV